MNLVGKENLYWTDHVRRKMTQYRLSESRVKRVLRHPKRREVGVAEDTVAGMQPAGSPKHPYEIWVMWTQKRKSDAKCHPERSEGSRSALTVRGIASPRFGGVRNDRVIIISVWRYPGISPLREPPPIPDDVWAVLKKIKKESSS